MYVSTFDSSIFSTSVFRLLRYHRNCGWRRSNDLVLRLLLFVHHQGVEGQEVATTSLDYSKSIQEVCEVKKFHLKRSERSIEVLSVTSLVKISSIKNFLYNDF